MKNHVKVQYISALGPQNLVNCIIHGGLKPQVFGGSSTGVTPPNGLELVHGFSYEFRKD